MSTETNISKRVPLVYTVFISLPDSIGVPFLDIAIEKIADSFSLCSLMAFYLDHALNFTIEHVPRDSVFLYLQRNDCLIFGPYSGDSTAEEDPE